MNGFPLLLDISLNRVYFNSFEDIFGGGGDPLTGWEPSNVLASNAAGTMVMESF